MKAVKIKLLELHPIRGARAAVGTVATKVGVRVSPDLAAIATPSYAITCIARKITFA
ncbi:hypothetical protein LBMAG56_39300 [Verrucomicrobiota bacterium]|nr:hypothetical protein LBMAG56_39300 [Verrucomicrobiota bacterium]